MVSGVSGFCDAPNSRSSARKLIFGFEHFLLSSVKWRNLHDGTQIAGRATKNCSSSKLAESIAQTGAMRYSKSGVQNQSATRLLQYLLRQPGRRAGEQARWDIPSLVFRTRQRLDSYNICCDNRDGGRVNRRDEIFQVWCAESGSDSTPTIFVAFEMRDVMFKMKCTEREHRFAIRP